MGSADARRDVAPCAAAVILTRRQAECLVWVEMGKTAWEIGRILGISPRTVEGYLAKAYERLGVTTKVQAVVRARRLGLLPESDA